MAYDSEFIKALVKRAEHAAATIEQEKTAIETLEEIGSPEAMVALLQLSLTGNVRSASKDLAFAAASRLRKALVEREPTEEIEPRAKRKIPESRRVFIVHGRNDKPALELARILEKDIGLEPIILREKPDEGKTIIEKLEKFSDVSYAFVILTPDDVGGLEELVKRDPSKALRPRARQNVVLEFGYFMGLLGRSKVCCLLQGDVERPSNMEGIIYKSFRNSVKECFHDITKELRAAGFKL